MHYYGTLIGSHSWRIEWYNFRWPWVTPNLGFKVAVFLQVDYLNNGATLLNSTTHKLLYTTRGSTENVQKSGVVIENFAQEKRKFSSLSGRDCGGRIKQRVADTIRLFLTAHVNHILNTDSNKLCRRPPQYAYAPASWQYIRIYSPGDGAVRVWQYLRIYSPGGTCSGMLAI